MIHAVLLYLALQAQAQNIPEHQQAGTAASKDGQTDVAIARLRKAIELNPHLASGYFDLGVAYIQNHDYGPAIPPLKKALELDPHLAAAHQFLGYALLSQGYVAEAVAQFKETNDQAGLGIAELEAGDFADAVQNLQVALVSRPNDPDLLYYLARASGLLSKQVYDVLLSSYPDTPRANQALAENYWALHQAPEAEAHYVAALRQRSDLPGVHLALGQVYAAAARWDKAQSEFRAEVKLKPGSAEAAYWLGTALLQDGKEHEARLELQRADKLQPDMPETLYALGKAESLEGNYPAAEREWNRLITLENSGPLASQSHFGLATIYRKQGKSADAEREMKQFEETRGSAKQP